VALFVCQRCILLDWAIEPLPAEVLGRCNEHVREWSAATLGINLRAYAALERIRRGKFLAGDSQREVMATLGNQGRASPRTLNQLRMQLSGSRDSGLTWRVFVDDAEVFSTQALAADDLDLALFAITRDTTRSNSSFLDIPDDALFTILDGFFCGPLSDALRASAEEQTWARHVVSPAVPTTIDSRMYLVEARDGRERLLVWRDGLRTFAFPTGAFDRELGFTIDRIRELSNSD
jgi:hypothetical protein